jgi:hypothetical protein
VNNINSGTVSSTNQYTSAQTITFAVNNSPGTLTYTAPSGASETVARRKWDLWVGTTKDFDEQDILDTTQTLSCFKIVYGSASSTVVFDNLLMTSLSTNAVEESASMPKSFTLEQNYPNPFNPSTEIRFGVEESATTKLVVYNFLGQEITTLFNGVAESGRLYKVTFDGSGFASGVYFYRLDSGRKSAVKRMAILK